MLKTICNHSKCLENCQKSRVVELELGGGKLLQLLGQTISQNFLFLIYVYCPNVTVYISVPQPTGRGIFLGNIKMTVLMVHLKTFIVKNIEIVTQKYVFRRRIIFAGWRMG